MQRTSRYGRGGVWVACICATMIGATASFPADEQVTRRTVVEVLPWLEALPGRPFSELAKAYGVSIDVREKGSAGMLLEAILGLAPSTITTDFKDAELKTNKSTPDGLPLETMYITQIASHIDDLLAHQSFDESWLAQKIERVVYVPVVKEGPPESWYFLHHHDVYTGPGSSLRPQLRRDFDQICEGMNADIAATGKLGTRSGKYIQIRTKDRKPYTPIYSVKYGRHVSDKNFAFYFRKDFMRDIAQGQAE